MFKFIAVFAFVAVASAAPGFVAETHHAVVQPAVLTKTAVVDNRASSAITHQSFTNLEHKVPEVATYAAAAPVVKTVHSYEAAPGFVAETHHAVEQPAVLTKTAVVDNRASSAITHQSFTNLEHKAPEVATYAAAAPVVKTVHSYEAAPVVHTYAAAPVVKTVDTPVVHTYAAAPVVHTYAAAPVVKTVAAPAVHTYAAAAPVVHSVPVVHSAPVLKTFVSSPVAYQAIH